MRNLLLIIMLAGSQMLSAQYIPDENSSSEPEKKPPVISAPWTQKPKDEVQKPPIGAAEDAQVEYVIELLFEHMRNADAQGVQSVFTSDARLMGTTLENGRPTIRNTAIRDFANRIGQAKPGALDEQITAIEVRIDENLASAWVDYNFYYEGNFHHCGVDAVQLHKGASGWKIFQLADTQRKDCENPADEINTVMNGWHEAATRADARAYFDRMHDTGIFLGTDETENWDKEEFYNFAKPYFDKGRAWDFTTKERNVFFSEGGDVAWFNELLETWMGPCRGSGVLTKDASGEWRIDQYNLAMLVPNDLVQDYIALRKSKGR
ncbi:MAG: nuclear transport factor 2 family protein [Saprospiraceae bacterium]|nr:nuclear transport factor 2 family protein [Saprospiraceae bacterium]